VLGQNAFPSIICGGGSSQTDPFISISLLDSIRKLAGSNLAVNYIPNWIGANPTAPAAFNMGTLFEAVNEDGQRGVKAEYFSSTDLSGKPVVSRVENGVNYMWGTWHPVDQITAPTFSARFVGKIKAPMSDLYTFSCNSDNARVMMDGNLLFDTQGAESKTIKMEAGETHEINIEYRHLAGPATIQFTWGKANKEFNDEEAKLLKEADAIVAGLGLNNYVECEGFDRAYDLPADQLELVQRIAKYNPHVLAVLNGGGNLGIEKWLDNVSGLIHAWYPGQNGNLAVAEAVFGDLNPSGKLPDTFEKRWEDSPAYGNYPGSSDNGGRVEYKEGIYVGYRWFDKKNIIPTFPFGYGLSYTSFLMHDLELKKSGAVVDATVKITNTGKRDGTEVVQVYVRPLNSSIDRPVQELKGFARVALKAGESKSVSIPLNADSFATYDSKAHSWISPDGQYEIAVGSSSRDIHCSQSIRWTH
jgi:beta-glucosidase